MSRKVTVYNTIGSNQVVVMSAAGTWGELQGDFDLHGISHHGMKVVVGETQVSLESSAAQLPTGDFRIFLMPQKVKSGYFEANEAYMVDWTHGITWDQVDWNDTAEVPEDHVFKTTKDLAVARAQKAAFYLNKIIAHLIETEKKSATDPEINMLAKAAEEIKKNMGLFD